LDLASRFTEIDLRQPRAEALTAGSRERLAAHVCLTVGGGHAGGHYCVTGLACILRGMFEAKERAEAVVLDVEPPGAFSETDMHGIEWEHRKYILEVRPAGQQPFRVETKAKVAIFHRPGEGDVVTVSFDPKNHKTEMHIDGDARYDPKLIREARKEHEAARKHALLTGAPDPDALARSHEIADRALAHNAEQLAWARHHPAAARPEPHHEPQWTVPAICPECGARVDQSIGSMAEHPRCEYCHNPLPRVRVQ
jgi:hypothetical protein